MVGCIAIDYKVESNLSTVTGAFDNNFTILGQFVNATDNRLSFQQTEISDLVAAVHSLENQRQQTKVASLTSPAYPLFNVYVNNTLIDASNATSSGLLRLYQRYVASQLPLRESFLAAASQNYTVTATLVNDTFLTHDYGPVHVDNGSILVQFVGQQVGPSQPISFSFKGDLVVKGILLQGVSLTYALPKGPSA